MGPGSEVPDATPTRENNPMDRQETPTVVMTVSRNLAELDRLCRTSVRMLHEHTQVGGFCVVCGLSWPCRPVRLAEHNLALL